MAEQPYRSNGGRLLLVAALLMYASGAAGEPVRVRFAEGLVHGFLVLRDPSGKAIADGDLIQTAARNRVTSRLVFRFRDGSIHDEVAVFSQQRVFRLVSDHLVQKGPSFPHALDMSIDVPKQQARVRYTDDKGEEHVETEELDGGGDLANGLILTLLKNVSPDTLPHSVSLVAATPKPRLVKLEITLAGVDGVRAGATIRKANHYVVSVDPGGLTGILAELLGKKPPDSHVWILGGNAPAFVTSEQPFYVGGPLWRIELVSPVGPRSSGREKR